MLRNFVRAIFRGIALLLLSTTSLAQSQPSYIANLSDTRFSGFEEDWTSPALNKSHLMPVLPLVSFVDQQRNYSISLVQVQWRPGDPIDLYVIKPNGVKKPPVIVCLYGYPSETDIFKNPKFQEFTTGGGFAAVGFMTALTGHRYHDIPMKKWFVSELPQTLAVSAHDVQMVLDYLASRGDLDMDRVGVYGQLSGASIAILASAMDPRIKVMDTLDPWGDWPTWMKMSTFVPTSERADYVKPEFLSRVAPLDPTDWMPKIQARRFRLQQRSFEYETPGQSKEDLQSAAPPGAVVAFYRTPNEFANAVGERTEKSLDWIKAELRSLPQTGSENSAVTVTKKFK